MVINTDSLIISREDALKTKRTCCFLEGNTELNLALAASKENILRRLYEEKSIITKPIENLKNRVKRDRCIIEKGIYNFELKLNGLFNVITETAAFATGGLVTARENLIVWFNSNPIYEMNSHLVIRNVKQFVDHYTSLGLDYTEHGIQIRLLKRFRVNAFMMFRANKFYHAIKDLLDDNTKFDSLSLDNFEQLFVLYFAFGLLIFVAFLIHHCVLRIQEIKRLDSISTDEQIETTEIIHIN